MLRALLIASLLLMPLACRRDDGQATRTERRTRSARVAMLTEMLSSLEKLSQRGQNVEAGCRSLRPQLDPLRIKADAQSREVLMRFHRLCSRVSRRGQKGY